MKSTIEEVYSKSAAIPANARNLDWVFWFEPRAYLSNHGCVLTVIVKVVPGASRDRVVGRYGDGIKVQVVAPPEDGKANKAVLRVLADFFELRIEQIEIARGQAQPRKVVRLTGISQAELDQKLSNLT